jgi:hypothetical protein
MSIVKQMDHTAYKKKVRKMDLHALVYVAKDAQAALNAIPDGPNAGYYQDEVLYCLDEIKRRGYTWQKAVDLTTV